MKVIKTAEGFELIPHTKDELERLRWLIECLQAHPSQRVVEVGSSETPCPRCSTFGNYDNKGKTCLACGYDYRDINEVIANTGAPQVRTFTTKGSVE